VTSCKVFSATRVLHSEGVIGRTANAVTPKVWMAERVGFVPDEPAHINDLGPFPISQIARNTQSLSIRYKKVQHKHSFLAAGPRCAAVS
jgi:hypothetical protein